MGKGLPRSQKHANPAITQAVKQAIAVKNVAITVDGATGIGFGTAVLGDFPAGNIVILGCVSYIQITKVTAAGTTDTFTGNYSLGSAPTADSTLSGAEVDIIPSTALSAATAGVSPLTRGATTTATAMLDNTDGSLEINLNVLIADASISANGQILRADGIIHILYSVLGDD